MRNPRSSARARASTALLPGLLLIPFLAFAPQKVTADPVAGEALAMESAMRLAVEQAPLISATQARTAAAREDAARAGALPDPTLTLAVDNLPIDGSDAFRFGPDMMTMRRIGVMQEWPSRRKRSARESLAAASVDSALANELDTSLAVQREAALAWLARWSAERRLALFDALLLEAERAQSIATARLEGGQGGAMDGLEASTALAEVEHRRITAAADRDVAIARLSRWIGDAQARYELAEPPSFDQLPVSAERLLAALDRHAPVQVASAQVIESERGIELAVAGKRPDLRFGMGYGARSNRDDMIMFEVGIGLPLFAGGRQDRDIAARSLDRAAAEAELEDVRRMQREQVETALAEWRGLQREAEHHQQHLLPLIRDRSRVALAAYSAGGPLQPWLDARSTEIEVRLQYIDIVTRLGASWAELATLLPEDAA